MISDPSKIRHKHLRAFWKSNGETTKGLPPDQIARLRMILVHLDSARNLGDIAEGLGKQRNHHQLEGHEHRYAMWVNGNDRVVYDCPDPSTGDVTIVFYGDYHRR